MNSDQLKQLVNLASQSYNPPPDQVPREVMWTRIRLARDYNRPQIAAPRDRMWERLVLLRAATTPLGLRQRGRPAVARVAGRDVRGPVSPRGRGGWMLVPLASLAAAALFVMIQTRPVSEPSSAASQTTFAQNAFEIPLPGQFTLQGDGMRSYAGDFSGRWYSIAADDPVSEAYRRAATTHLKKSDALITGFRSLSNNEVVNRDMRTAVRELLSNTRLLLHSPASIQSQYRGVFLDLELVLVKMTLLTPATVASDRRQIETSVERSNLVRRMRDLVPAPSASNAN